MRKLLTILPVLLLISTSTWGQCNEAYQPKEWISDTTYLFKADHFEGYIFPRGYHGPILAENLKTFTLNRAEVETTEKLLSKDFNSVFQHDARVEGYKPKAHIKRFLQNFDRQYLGFMNKSGQRCVALILVKRKGGNGKHFPCFDKIMSLGFDGPYNKGIQYYLIVNLDEQKLILP